MVCDILKSEKGVSRIQTVFNISKMLIVSPHASEFA